MRVNGGQKLTTQKVRKRAKMAKTVQNERKSEKPRIRLGCPSRTTFSQAPQKLLLVDFWQKREIGPPGGGVAVLQERSLALLLVLPRKQAKNCAMIEVLFVARFWQSASGHRAAAVCVMPRIISSS